MMDLTAFMSHLYSENPLVSEPLSGLQGNLEAVLAKGSFSTFQSSPCIGHFWRTQIHGNKMHVCHAFYFHQINGFLWNECGTSKQNKLLFCGFGYWN